MICPKYFSSLKINQSKDMFLICSSHPFSLVVLETGLVIQPRSVVQNREWQVVIAQQGKGLYFMILIP